jgi:hypothetical protein
MPEPTVSPSPTPSSPPPAARSPDPGLVIGSNPAISEPQRRWAEERARIQESDVWQQDPTRTTIRKSSDGTVTAVPRTADPAAAPQPGDQPKPAGEQQQPPQPLNSDGKIQLTQDIALSEQELRDLLAHKSAEDSRRLTAPTKVEDFRLELPSDLKMPQGVDFRIDPNNPAVEPARAFALRNNLSQQQFSEMLGVYAASQANEMVAFNTAKAAEVAKLGDAANARVDAVRGWLRSMVPEHFDGLARVLEMAPSAATVKGLEALMHRYVTQGSGGFMAQVALPAPPFGRILADEHLLRAGRRGDRLLPYPALEPFPGPHVGSPGPWSG